MKTLNTFYVNGYTPDDEDYELTVQAHDEDDARQLATETIPGLTPVDVLDLNGDEQ